MKYEAECIPKQNNFLLCQENLYWKCEEKMHYVQISTYLCHAAATQNFFEQNVFCDTTGMCNIRHLRKKK